MSGDTDSCLIRRVAKTGAPLDLAWQEHLPVDLRAAGEEIVKHIRPTRKAFDLSVATRMVFSCLVDADYRDTEAFYAELEKRAKERPQADLNSCCPHSVGALMSTWQGIANLFERG